jgi:hypothetical protein
MIQRCPIQFAVKQYSGSDPKKRAEVGAHNDLAAKIADHINAMKPGVRAFEAPELAKVFRVDADEVRAVIGGNGITVEK